MNWRSFFSFRYFSSICCLFSALLAILSAASFAFKMIEGCEKEKKISSIERDLLKLSAHSMQKQQAENAARKADRHYLEKQLSSLPLLNLEMGSLELLARKQPLNESETRRLHFIQKENILHFQPYRKLDNGLGKEIEEKLSHTAEIDANDLQIILERLEGKESLEERPSLRIRRLSLEIKDNSPHYSLYLELWRKEIP